jgi:hypothetical protein
LRKNYLVTQGFVFKINGQLKLQLFSFHFEGWRIEPYIFIAFIYVMANIFRLEKYFFKIEGRKLPHSVAAEVEA